MFYNEQELIINILALRRNKKKYSESLTVLQYL